MFSNDEATKLFIAVGTGKFCIDRTSMFTIVDVLTSFNLVTSYYSNVETTLLSWLNNIVDNVVHAGQYIVVLIW